MGASGSAVRRRQAAGGPGSGRRAAWHAHRADRLQASTGRGTEQQQHCLGDHQLAAGAPRTCWSWQGLAHEDQWAAVAGQWRGLGSRVLLQRAGGDVAAAHRAHPPMQHRPDDRRPECNCSGSVLQQGLEQRAGAMAGDPTALLATVAQAQQQVGSGGAMPAIGPTCRPAAAGACRGRLCLPPPLPPPGAHAPDLTCPPITHLPAAAGPAGIHCQGSDR